MFWFCEADGRSGWHIKGDLIPLIFSLKVAQTIVEAQCTPFY
jgi:hypothetical protein